MVLNALAGTAAGLTHGMSLEDIKAGIENAKGISGRSNIIVKEDVILIDDCYNANPKSMKAAIDLLNSSGTVNIAILGDMFELGENEEKLHADIGTYISDKNVDVVVCVGNLSAHIYDSIDKKNIKKIYFSELSECKDNISEILKEYKGTKKPAVLIKASHGMHFEELINLI